MLRPATLLLYNCCLLLLLALLARETEGGGVRTLCAGSDDCSRSCRPEVWDRQLCVFYSELAEWRSSVADCGLATDAGERDTSLPADQQWREARSYWYDLRAAWEESRGRAAAAASEEGVAGSPSYVDSLELWRQDTDSWLRDLQDWKEEVFSEAGLSLPAVQGAGSTTPTSQWTGYIDEWSSSFSSYNTTFFGQCPTT